MHEPLGLDPLLRWAGGKRWLVPVLGPKIRARLAETGGRYIEPFAGGAAIALWLGRPGTLLSDTCQAVIDCYRGIARRPDKVRKALIELAEYGTDEHAYYHIRGLTFDQLEKKAARVLYLNALCYNGLWRENRKGWMNVPLDGSRKGVVIPEPWVMIDYSRAFQKFELLVRDFERVIDGAEAGDVVYADPPYFGGFANYTADGFDLDDQETLAAVLLEAAERGVTVVTTNADRPEIRKFYKWAHVTTTEEMRAINSDAKGRGATPCLIASNDLGMVT